MQMAVILFGEFWISLKLGAFGQPGGSFQHLMTVIRPTTAAQVLTQCVVFSRDLPIGVLSAQQLCPGTNFVLTRILLPPFLHAKFLQIVKICSGRAALPSSTYCLLTKFPILSHFKEKKSGRSRAVLQMKINPTL